VLPSNSADISSAAIQLFLMSCYAKRRRNTISFGQPAIVPFARVNYRKARNAFTSETAKKNAHRESSTEGKQWRRLWKYDCQELLRDLRRCASFPSTNSINEKHDVQQRATGSVVFVSKWMRFARKNTQPGHVHLLCQIDIDSSRMTHAHRNMLIWRTDQNLSTKAGL
jgi:hypothetical protein